MSLDSRLRDDLRAIAETVEPEVEPVLASLMARRDRDPGSRGVLTKVLVAAACLALVGGLAVWWLGRAHGHDRDIVNDPEPPSGTYGARLSGDLAGEWRLRFGDEILSVVAPDRSAFGQRSAFGSYAEDGGVLTTDLLGDGPCSGEGTYRWTRTDGRLQLTVVDDTCELRQQILGSVGWGAVQGERFEPGTYQSKLTIGQMRRTALAEGFSRADVDAYLDEQFPGASEVTYTLKTEQGLWTVYASIDGGPQGNSWWGGFTVLDAATVEAGEYPCGPIVYDYASTPMPMPTLVPWRSWS